MSKDVFCYSLPVTSPQGRLMEAFWHQCIKADRAAEDYAVRYGATQYEQPVQYFAGGVDYLIFDPERKPNPNIFRLRHITPDGDELYEPNCMYSNELILLPDADFRPSDTWDRLYGQKPVAWADASHTKPLTYFAAMANYVLSGKKDIDRAYLDSKFKDSYFLPYILYYSPDSSTPAPSSTAKKSAASRALRQAIRAEKERVRLPVIRTEALFSILGIKEPETRRQIRKFTRTEPSINFFFVQDRVYIRSSHECTGADLTRVQPSTYANWQAEAERLAEQKNQ